MKRLALVLTIFLNLSHLFSDDYRIVPNFGHHGSVSTLYADEKRDVLISLGQDSTCLVTDLSHNRVINRIEDLGNIKLFSFNPVFPEFALINEINGHFVLRTYDWQSGELLFELSLEDIPFYINYSRTGETLFWQSMMSVQMVEHQVGEPVESPQEINSLLTYGYMGGSGKTYMGYNPSGELIYFDRYTSAIKGQAPTLSDLEEIHVLSTNIQYISAKKENSIYLINRQTGQVVDSEDFDSILAYNCQPEQGIITVLSEDDENYRIYSYSAKNSISQLSDLTLKKEEVELTSALTYERKVYLGNNLGDLSLLVKDNAENIFPESPLKISSIAMSNDLLFLEGGGLINLWESPFFEKDDQSTNQLLRLLHHNIEAPYGDIHFSTVLDKTLLWSSNEYRKNQYIIQTTPYDLILFGEEINPTEGNNPFGEMPKKDGYVNISYFGDLQIILDADKNCKINRLTEDKETSEIDIENIYAFNHPSLEVVSMVGDRSLILGRNKFFGGKESLNLVDITTGETLRIEDDRDIITRILLTEKNFYTVGFQVSDQGSLCVIKKHDLENPSIPGEAIFSIKQESSQDCILTQNLEGELYLSLPNGDWYRLGEEGEEKSPTKSIVPPIPHRGYLYTIDQNHSLLISEESTLEPLVKVTFFNGGEWLALDLKSDYYFHSVNARKLFSLFKY